MDVESIQPSKVIDAHERIRSYIHKTPVLESSLLNQMLGHKIRFKCENFQKIGAFKARGALNKLLYLQERGELPQKVVAFSSGNHAQAVAWAGKQLGVDVTVFCPVFSSSIKVQATRGYGAKVIETKTRQQAEQLAAQAQAQGALLIPPFDDDEVIAGQGTACLEALQEGVSPDAVFVPCGGGGLISGTYLALQALSPQSKCFAGEPAKANDAVLSLKRGRIFRFQDAPETIADGAKTLGVAERTFQYIQRADGIFEISEAAILYWTQWLTHLLKISCEPTSALAMAAAQQWLVKQTTSKQVLIIISGGNVAPDTQQRIWSKDYLAQIPLLSGHIA